jgi:redox-sensitive bicupin YhaK (pirin superfamily)
MPVRVIRGEVGSTDFTTRIIIPTSAQPTWPPFERVAETIASPRRPFRAHRHAGVEVLTYVIEGSAAYQLGSSSPEPLERDSLRFLTAPDPVAHSINPGAGRTVRLFALVVTLPPGVARGTQLQSGRARASDLQPDGTVSRRLVGPSGPLTSVSGVECDVVEFRNAGTSFLKVGHARRAVVYALSGPGVVDGDALDGGEAALIEGAAGVALKGEPGFHVIIANAPAGVASPSPAAGPGSSY